MKKGFMSIDGKFFTSEAKCQEHERNIGFLMYTEDGLTEDVESAYVVFINNATGLSDFLSMCRVHSVGCSEFTGTGTWVWSDRHKVFVPINTFAAEAVAKMYIDRFGPIEE